MALTTNLVSYWKLDGNSNDAVSTNNGSDTAITYSLANGKINQGAGVTSTSYIENTSPTNIPTGATARTVNLWVKATTVTSASGQYAFGYGTGTTRELFLLGIDATGHAAVATYADDLSGLTVLSNGTWYMLTAVYDGNLTTTIYVNGSLDGTHTLGGILNTILSTTGITISDLHWGNGPAGAIDEVGIWSRALTSTEVTQLYNSGAGLPYPFPIVMNNSEAITNSDTLIRTVVRPITEAIANSDTIYNLRTAFATLSDAITNTDTVVRSIVRTATEAIVNTDTLIRTTARAWADAITNTDTVVGMKVQYANLIESIITTDAFIRSTVRTLAEAITNTEVFTIIDRRFTTLTEAITSSDTFTKVWTHLLALGEQISNTPFFTKLINGWPAIWGDDTKHATTFTADVKDSTIWTDVPPSS